MDKGILVFFLTTCAASGAFVGGFSEALHNSAYAEAMSNPAFFHLVDENGNPVSQEIK